MPHEDCRIFRGLVENGTDFVDLRVLVALDIGGAVHLEVDLVRLLAWLDVFVGHVKIIIEIIREGCICRTSA